MANNIQKMIPFFIFSWHGKLLPKALHVKLVDLCLFNKGRHYGLLHCFYNTTTTQTTETNDQERTCRKRLNFKERLKARKPVVVEEKDLEEKFIRGSGKGGQKVNKTSSSVYIKHIPTGIEIKCQSYRELEANRKEARRILGLKLDILINRDNSKTAIKIDRLRERKRQKEKKRKRLALSSSTLSMNPPSTQ